MQPLSAQSGLKDERFPSVLIVILNWNTPQDTLAAIKSVFGLEYPNYKLIVIDNGSSDESLSILANIINEKFQLIPLASNLGYTGGCNYAFDIAIKDQFDFVWLLNSDAITKPDTLSSLVQVAQQEARIGLVSPVIASLEVPERIINVGGLYRWEIPACEQTRSLEFARKWTADFPDQILLLGTALLVKTSLIRKIGLLDKRLFAYWEDTDYSLRSIKAGFCNIIDFESTVYHSEKMVRNQPQTLKPYYWYYLARNEILFWKKHRGIFARIKPLWWAYQTQLQIYNRLLSNKKACQALLAGLWDGWLNKEGSYYQNAHMPRLVAWLITHHSKSFVEDTVLDSIT